MSQSFPPLLEINSQELYRMLELDSQQVANYCSDLVLLDSQELFKRLDQLSGSTGGSQALMQTLSQPLKEDHNNNNNNNTKNDPYINVAQKSMKTIVNNNDEFGLASQPNLCSYKQMTPSSNDQQQQQPIRCLSPEIAINFSSPEDSAIRSSYPTEEKCSIPQYSSLGSPELCLDFLSPTNSSHNKSSQSPPVSHRCTPPKKRPYSLSSIDANNAADSLIQLSQSMITNVSSEQQCYYQRPSIMSSLETPSLSSPLLSQSSLNSRVQQQPNNNSSIIDGKQNLLHSYLQSCTMYNYHHQPTDITNNKNNDNYLFTEPILKNSKNRSSRRSSRSSSNRAVAIPVAKVAKGKSSVEKFNEINNKKANNYRQSKSSAAIENIENKRKRSTTTTIASNSKRKCSSSISKPVNLSTKRMRNASISSTSTPSCYAPSVESDHSSDQSEKLDLSGGSLKKLIVENNSRQKPSNGSSKQKQEHKEEKKIPLNCQLNINCNTNFATTTTPTKVSTKSSNKTTPTTPSVAVAALSPTDTNGSSEYTDAVSSISADETAVAALKNLSNNKADESMDDKLDKRERNRLAAKRLRDKRRDERYTAAEQYAFWKDKVDKNKVLVQKLEAEIFFYRDLLRKSNIIMPMVHKPAPAAPLPTTIPDIKNEG